MQCAPPRVVCWVTVVYVMCSGSALGSVSLSSWRGAPAPHTAPTRPSPDKAGVMRFHVQDAFTHPTGGLSRRQLPGGAKHQPFLLARS
ncbi:unnamed protein product [Gadus morhua 'NCC']